MNVKSSLAIVTFAILAPAFLAPSLHAQRPDKLSYQGYLEEGGTAVTGSRDFIARLFTVPSGGSAFWQESYSGVSVQKGVYNLQLGQTSPLKEFSNLDRWSGLETLWLEVQVGATVLSPRTALAAAPFALALASPIRVTETQAFLAPIDARNDAPENGLAILAQTSGQFGTAVQAMSSGPSSTGVYGSGSSMGGNFSGGFIGVQGSSQSTDSFGGYFIGHTGLLAAGNGNSATAPDIVLSTSLGHISTDSDFTSSDLLLRSMDDVDVRLDSDANDATSDFKVSKSTGDAVFQVTNGGAATISGDGDQPSPQLSILHTQNQTSDYARLRMKNATNSEYWDIRGGGAGNGSLNFFKFATGEVMTLVGTGTGTGRVGILTTAPAFTLEVNGTAGKTGGGSWSTPSDARLKTVDGTFDRGLDELLQLEPVRFHYLADNPRGFSPEPEHIGFVAQEVQKVIPEAIQENEGYLFVNNDPILWTMVNAIRDLHEENQALRAQLQAISAHLGLSASQTAQATAHAPVGKPE